MGRGPAGPRDGHLSLEAEYRNDTFGTRCQFPDSGEPGGMPGRADMGRRRARPRDGHLSIELEKRNDTFGRGCPFPDSGEPGGCRGGQIWAGGQPGPEMVICQ